MAVWRWANGVRALFEYLMVSPQRVGILACTSAMKEFATALESLVDETVGGDLRTQQPG